MKFYRDDAIIFCKVTCTHCGSDTELMHINLSARNEINGSITSYDTVLCRGCYRELPSREEEEN